MSDSADSSLLDLFREEVRSNTRLIADGLVALEHEPGSADRLQALMRAAHSVKGAARVVNLPPAVDVAHAMEDVFVRAQQGQLALAPSIVDVLLQGGDLLQAMADAAGSDFSNWQSGRQAEIATLLARLRDAGKAPPTERADPQASTEAPAAAEQPQATPETTRRSVRKQPARKKTAAAPAGPPPPPAERAGVPPATPPPAARRSATAAGETVVRVSARSLTRLMSLAGESLVQARWLLPFSKSLVQLKRMQMRLEDDLERIREALVADSGADGTAASLADAAQRLASCTRLLTERIDEFENRIRSTDDLTSRLYREVISSRMRPFRDGLHGMARLVRDLGQQLGKKARLEVEGESTEVDRDILDQLDAPLNHLVRNMLDHGLEPPAERLRAGKPETGCVRIEATHRAGMLAIAISDDGRGIDIDAIRRRVVAGGHATEAMAGQFSQEEVLEFLFLPGFSTAAAVTEVSGRGVGLDAVRSMVQAVGGHVSVRTEPGWGTTFQLELPVTLSVLRAVIVEIAGEPYAFPHIRIDRVVQAACEDLRTVENYQYLEIDGRNVGVVLGRQVLGLEGPQPEGDDVTALLFAEGSECYGLVVDRVLGEQDLVVRPLDRRLGKVPEIHAAALLEDGSPVLIVDLDDLRQSIGRLRERGRLQRAEGRAKRVEEKLEKRVLVVDDSITVREMERQLLVNRGYRVQTAVDGLEGWNLLHEGLYDLILTDVDMPRMGGLELVRRVKEDRILQTIPVILVSYKDREEDRIKGMEAGADHYLTKSSFHDDTLIEAVRDLIGEAGE